MTIARFPLTNGGLKHVPITPDGRRRLRHDRVDARVRVGVLLTATVAGRGRGVGGRGHADGPPAWLVAEARHASEPPSAERPTRCAPGGTSITLSRRKLLSRATLAAAGIAAPAILTRPAGAAEFTYKFGGSLPAE